MTVNNDELDTQDGSVQDLIDQAHDVKTETVALREAVIDFADITRRGLIRATWQGILMIVGGIILAVSLLGYLGQDYTCGPTYFVEHPGSTREKVCKVVFPQTEQQMNQIKAAEREHDLAVERNRKLDEILEFIEEVRPRIERD